MSNPFWLPQRRRLAQTYSSRGLDLFNHGYYWEAHEAWEGLWQVADRDGPLRMLFKGLIMLSAAGVKFESANMRRLELMADALRLCFVG